MEAMILAKPAPTQNDARQPDSPLSQESNGEEFAPVLDAEVNRSKQSTEAADDVTTVEAAPETSADTIPESETDSTSATIQAAGVSSPDSILAAFQGTAEITKNATTLQISATTTTAAIDLPTETLNSITSAQQQQNESGKLVFTAADVQQALTESSVPKEITAPQTAQTAQPTRAETLLIEQIQQLLIKNQNNGPISIESTGFKAGSTPAGATNNILAGNTSVVQVSQQLSTVTIPVETNAGENDKATSLEGARQDTTNQFLKAKAVKSVTANNDQSKQSTSDQQQGSSQNKDNMQTAAATPLTAPVSTTPNDGQPISQFSMLTPTATTAQTSIEGKLAPGAHLPIQQHEIVDNLIQRFNVNPRLKTGNISIQLNPVELGALKINILVKDDSISANIIAQSQQIIDTIDKHMPKLRAVLESQGFTIDTFEVTLDSKTDSQHELFQEQFTSQQQNSFESSHSTGFEDEAFETELNSAALPEMSDDLNTESSGVNVTV